MYTSHKETSPKIKIVDRNSVKQKTMLKRHRGIYDKNNTAPYELSRSRVENFVRCPACFYLQQVKGIKFPSIPGFNINEATDVLLKRDFDKYRGQENTHPFLMSLGESDLIPFKHENFELWTQSLHFGAVGRMHFIHEKTNLKVGGGLDDVWINRKSGKLHIVDYKSTSQKAEGKTISLDDPWKDGYKRQMDLYVWIMRHMGFDVADLGYFLYCDGDRFSDYDFLGSEAATMKFSMSLLSYKVDTSWIEPTLADIKICLDASRQPQHSATCEMGQFLKSLTELNLG